MDKNQTLKIFCVTYNLHGLSPTEKEVSDLFDNYKNYDLYVIGTQECLRPIFQSLFIQDKKLWEELLQNYFNQFNIVQLKSVTLGPLHLIIFIKNELIKDKRNIQFIGSNFIKTGFYGFIANKGANYIWFKLFNIKFLFINCHLSAFKKKHHIRIQHYNTITNNIVISNEKEMLNCVDLKGWDVINKFDVCVFLGDFNSRSEISLENANKLSNEKSFNSQVLDLDQWNNSIKKGELNMRNFKENSIEFEPTYKVKNVIGCEFVNDSEDHIPSFTDRIFYSINLENYKCENYTSLSNISFSDHKPVILTITLNI